MALQFPQARRTPVALAITFTMSALAVSACGTAPTQPMGAPAATTAPAPQQSATPEATPSATPTESAMPTTAPPAPPAPESTPQAPDENDSQGQGSEGSDGNGTDGGSNGRTDKGDDSNGTSSSRSGSAEKKSTPDSGPRRAGAAILSEGASGDKVSELQARLAQLSWFDGKVTGYYGSQTASAVSGFQAKRGLQATGRVDQTTWDALVGMTRQPNAAETRPDSGGQKASGLDSRCMTGRVICISKDENQLRWVVDGKVLSSMDVRFGSEQNPTREGQFSVNFKSRDHVSTLYHTPMPYAMFFSGGQAVHYSADFAARGYRGGSHGCVNVRDRGAVQSLFNQVRPGDKVIVYG